MNCCPLQNFGIDKLPVPETFRSGKRTARKDHTCTECFEKITNGTRYEYTFGIWDAHPSVYKTCLSCVEIRDHFACDGSYAFGQLWTDLEENFFPDMPAGDPCLQGLSPEAKNRLFEKHTEWLFATEG